MSNDWINVPADFDGTDAQRIANRRSHSFGDGRCVFCDSARWHVAADWPCGQQPPRIWVRG